MQSIELSGADAMEKAAAMMADLRSNAPERIGGEQVTDVRDYLAGLATDSQNGNQTKIDLPKSNVLEFVLGDKGSVIVRPSGTEPKVKFYYTAITDSKCTAKTLLDRMIAQMSAR